MAERIGPWLITRTTYTTPKYLAIECSIWACSAAAVVLLFQHIPGVASPLVLVALAINFWLRRWVTNDLVAATDAIAQQVQRAG